MKKVYCFAHGVDTYNGSFNINSGICMGYILIDLVRRIARIKKIEDPTKYYHGDDVDFLWFDGSHYIDDLDRVEQTEEYENSLFLRKYSELYFGLKRKKEDVKKDAEKFFTVRSFAGICAKIYILMWPAREKVPGISSGS